MTVEGPRLSHDKMAERVGKTLAEARSARSQRPRASAKLLLLLLAIGFSVQVFTPLRLNTDAIVLLSMADSAAQGKGFLADGQKTLFPPGYPALLTLLLRERLAHSWVIVGLNLIFLAVGLLAAYGVLLDDFFADRTVALLICAFFLMSWPVIKHCTIPLTDVPFFCFSMSSIAMMSRARSGQSNLRLGVLLGAAGLLALAAMTIRTIGAALFLPLLFATVSGFQVVSRLKSLSLVAKLAISAGGALLCGAAAAMLAATPYWRFFVGGGTQGGTFRSIGRILSYRLIELGELFGNVSTFRLPAKLHVVVPWIGFLALLVIVIGATSSGKHARVRVSDVFVLSYMGVFLLWPFYDSRYLLPVIPFFAAYVVLAVNRLQVPRPLLALYCVAYGVLGFAVLAYSTWITFAGAKFPYRYGDGNLRASYCAAFQSCADPHVAENANPRVVRLIREYE